jgi:hypothetical protein
MNTRNSVGLLKSQARTAATASPQQTSYVAHTARFYLNVSAASGTGGLTFQLRGYDKESGLSVVLFADTAAITATGTYVFEIAPSVGAASSGRRAVLSAFLPVTWDVNIAVGDASSYTYSLSAEITS